MGWGREVLAACIWLMPILLAVAGSTLGQTQFIYNQF